MCFWVRLLIAGPERLGAPNGLARTPRSFKIAERSKDTGLPGFELGQEASCNPQDAEGLRPTPHSGHTSVILSLCAPFADT
jgi:hypothetical protein